MQSDILPEVVSKPVYRSVVKHPRAQHHLFVSNEPLTGAAESIFNSCAEGERSLIVVADSQNLAANVAELVSELPLASCLYLAGEESFMWVVAELFFAEGLREDQLQFFKPTSQGRAIFCCHCYQVTQGVTHSPSACAGCGRLLLVTDHFSRKNASYFAYQANAEDPQDIPKTEKLS
ncbi:dimethylamine monooxygenase subunit DmmA family protein [Reinekea thalattae]|uniref:Dimethylamine monooxygenase subunit DmmA-like C-terminal domain-containing protein n=1 Tax=Reinekea thalattae TaxID=2593301 RepID=A0A5C8Z4Y2_9GAMM|nr:dimethylamine monooxygenase subunit DmmA family protein [Reinekea thalattae]TXR53155.1 hypothetical protein FME95_00860 [Reinekea thalattae]